MCKTLSKKTNKRFFVNVDPCAVYDMDNHWICDCGHWTTEDDDFHISIKQGLRQTAYVEIDYNGNRKICFDN